MDRKQILCRSAEVNGTKPKSLRYRRAEYLTDSKRAEQWKNSCSALNSFIWMFSATILRPLTSARNYATIACRKSKFGGAAKGNQSKRTIMPKKSRVKNNPNFGYFPRFGLFWYGADNRNRTCTVAHRILSPARLPVPPYPH